MSVTDAKPIWTQTSALPTFSPLDRDLTVDVAIVGGGLVGITTAYLLKAAGLRVAVLERGRLASVDTGHTTAHLTMVTDERLSDLVGRFGRDTAAAVWDAGRIAVDEIEAMVEVEHIDCDFRRVPGFLLEPLAGDGATRDDLQADATQAAELGFSAASVAEVSPFGRAGVRFDQQALFHPRRYLEGLLRAIPGDGSWVFENSAAESVQDEPLAITANGHTVSCGYVVLATHNPLVGKSSMLSASLLQSKLALYTSYALGGRLPSGVVAPGLYWDTTDPYHYLRVEQKHEFDYAIFGGADHKTGQEPDTRARWDALAATLHRFLPSCEVTDRWSGQVIETNDGLPYIGETADRQFVATGFAGNGMTFGTIAAMMARDAVLGRTNPWRAIFDPRRTQVRGGTWDYITENKDYAYYMLRDRLASRRGPSVRNLRPGDGTVVTLDGQRVAAYRDRSGVVSMCSAVCPHMGCEVHFNPAETSWDCPCHGSRFRVDGTIIAGPAESPLPPAE